MEEIRIGVYVCWCGTNIAKMVDVEAVAKAMREIPGVIVAKDYKYMCSDPGQELIIQDIKEHNLNRVVVSACSPRIHELTFRKALENAGLNPYMFEMANIREHDSWVHTDRAEATQKAKALVAGAINRVRWHESLDKRSVEINPATLIIGGGIAGISAALEIADAGKQVYLVEKQSQLGGTVAKLDLLFPHLDSAQQLIQPKINRAMNHLSIQCFLNAEIREVFGYIGNFEAKVYQKDDLETEIQFGNVIVATGLKPFDPSKIDQLNYKRLPNVITSLELEEKLLSGNLVMDNGKDPKHIALIHCIGSRNKNHHEYCSRTCCNTALKYSNQIRSAFPDAAIYEIYSDIRSFGKGCEELYTHTARQDVMFLMYDQKGEVPKITEARHSEKVNMMLEFREQLSGEHVEVPADLVVLMVAMEAHENAKEIAHAVGVSMCGNSFYIEKHPKLDPVATTTGGVYVVGSCQSPKDIPDSVSQARAAAARIMADINFGSVEVEVTTAVVNEDICCGCQTCISVCPYTAIHFDAEKNVSVVNEILCKGCGTCGSACPTGAIRSRHFTDKQILSQIEGLMSMQLQH
ncbi:MAG: CoB--CoM heterodisulfide reductase iron-sulfur subunit A family protein [Bacteroidales bacterium]|nr:CoB--CoM heterodisulfide reductase iron-sulfur subunit A family protein [Bacteroidales bacterium]MCF8457664.1 CoB--CoM heterodisulfide reductase iron-sulfur subunit A family protein [Bacteroidales bacterium]